MATPADLREWIALLEREGELVRIQAEADPDLEITGPPRPRVSQNAGTATP